MKRVFAGRPAAPGDLLRGGLGQGADASGHVAAHAPDAKALAPRPPALAADTLTCTQPAFCASVVKQPRGRQVTQTRSATA